MVARKRVRITESVDGWKVKEKIVLVTKQVRSQARVNNRGVGVGGRQGRKLLRESG